MFGKPGVGAGGLGAAGGCKIASVFSIFDALKEHEAKICKTEEPMLHWIVCS